jgi:hypothetical protein
MTTKTKRKPKPKTPPKTVKVVAVPAPVTVALGPSGGAYVVGFMRALRKSEAWLSSSAIGRYYQLTSSQTLAVERALKSPPMFSRYLNLGSRRDIVGNRLFLIRVV